MYKSPTSSSSSIFENSMTQEYQHQDQQQEQQQANIFSFPNGFDRSAGLIQRHTRGEDPSEGILPVYESAGMLSEMFNFGHSTVSPNTATPPELLDYRRGLVGGVTQEWYGSGREVAQSQRQVIGDQQQHHQHELNGGPPHHQHHLLGGINAHTSAATAVRLFLSNPPPRSPSPPLSQPQNIQTSCGGGFHSVVHHPSTGSNNPNFWGGPSHQLQHHHNHQINNPGEFSGMLEAQGLSLSLSSSLQHLEASKQAGDHSHITFFKNLQPVVGDFASPNSSNVGFGSVASGSSSLGVVNVLRNSKYTKPALELLEEFCSVGRGQLKKPKLGRQNSSNNPNAATSGGAGEAGPSSSSKNPPQVSSADRLEHQRRKVKLLAMLDEVDRRYNHYCEQMQMVVNSFDIVMGYGAAVPYTALAQKAMSRHFRCLKDAIHTQLKQSCEVLGEKDPTASSGLTKGETPRLKVLEQSLRQQRAFHQMGMMDQEAWRPQRGLPERSVNILRAWLFEHFLHPYPSDADKHLLARQTGLSRNQVSNWFINARVRLWKPMVEDMYQQESKDNEEDNEINERSDHQTSNSTNKNNNYYNNDDNLETTPRPQFQQRPAVAQNPMPSSSAPVSATTSLTEGKRSADHHNAGMQCTLPDCDPSLDVINRRPHQQCQQQLPPPHPVASVLPHQTFLQGMNDTSRFPDDTSYTVGPTTMIRFGASTSDVSLTLGLQHAGNRDFGSC